MQSQVITALAALLLCVASTSGTARRMYGMRYIHHPYQPDPRANVVDDLGDSEMLPKVSMECSYKNMPDDPTNYYCCSVDKHMEVPAMRTSGDEELRCSARSFPPEDQEYFCCHVSDQVPESRGQQRVPPRSPQEAPGTRHLYPGLRATLLAAARSNN
ncbi:uncharacterized protein LOC134540154 isoform X1 [Bacillus rossius redtenbacheri]|uniref:uncharacterized protein LOC134540154 isoform X1 n=1 Tax=Bacillus rossius redtenbacheri TaxID=93214 RepID=UPI002FDDD5B0